MSNDSPQSVRSAITENDRRVARESNASTYHQFATGEADPVRDRFEEINRSSVTGTTPAQRYPKGPDWCVDPTSVEPPLGFSVGEMIPVGEPHEIAALALAESRGGEGRSAGPPHPAASSAPSPPQRKRRRRASD